jgi:tetratricopeptide (TPR) repeat protein
MSQSPTSGARTAAAGNVAPDAQLARKLAALVGFFGFALYFNSLFNRYTLDDRTLILENRFVQQGVSGLASIFRHSYRYGCGNLQDELYRPLSTAMFALEWHLAGRMPAFHHLIGVVFYALTGGLLVLMLHRLFEQRRLRVALVASLLFMAHPLHTDAVSGIKGRDEIMSGFFAVAALSLVLGYLDSGRTRLAVAAGATYFLSLLSKESSITLVAIVPLMAWFFRRVTFRSALVASLAFAGPALIYLAIRAQVLAGGVTGKIDLTPLDNVLVSAPDYASRLSTILLTLGRYLKLLAIPYPLVCDYSYAATELVSWSDQRVGLAILAHLGIVAVIALGIRKRRLVAFGLLFYLVTLSLVSNLAVTIGANMAERFLYLPLLGIVLVLADVLVRVTGAQEPAAGAGVVQLIRSNARLCAVLLPLVVVYSIHTVARTAEWRDNLTLYGADVVKSPRNARLHYLLGSTLVNETALTEPDEARRAASLDLAVEELREAIRIYAPYADAYAQLGVAHYRKGDKEAAVEHYRRALELAPYSAATYSHLGVCFCEMGRMNEGIEMLERAVQYDPTYLDGLANLGLAYAMQSQWDNSIACFERLLALQPGDSHAWRSLAEAYDQKGETVTAQRYRDRALELEGR